MARAGGFSFMGGGDFAEKVGRSCGEEFCLQYDMKTKTLTEFSPRPGQPARKETLRGSFLDYFRDTMEKKGHNTQVAIEPPGVSLPFDFHGGYVGYFGYELKAETLQGYGPANPAHPSADCPETAWFFSGLTVALDHGARKIYLLSLGSMNDADGSDPVRSDQALLDRLLQENLEAMAVKEEALPPSPSEKSAPVLRPHHDQAEYGQRVLACIEQLRKGESYELCFTTRWSSDSVEDQSQERLWDIYRGLRKRSPAPYGCYLEVPHADDDSRIFTVLSSSPERFSKVDHHRWAEMKPIKGTCRRGKTHEEDEELKTFLERDKKNRAENL